MAHQAFAVIAGRGGLDDLGDARRAQAGQENRGLDLGRWHRKPVAHGPKQVAAGNGERQAPAVARPNVGTHQGERFGDPAHRPADQRGIAGEGRGHGMGGQNAHEQPHAGARIAEIEHLFRLAEAADAPAPDVPAAIRPARGLRPQRAERRRGAYHVLALEQPIDGAFTDRQRRQHEGAVRDRLVAGDA